MRTFACSTIVEAYCCTKPVPALVPARVRRRLRRARVQRAAADRAQDASGGGGEAVRPQAPWAITWDLKERDTLWTEENQSRLVRIVAGYELDVDVEEVEARLEELATLLPGLGPRLAHVRPSTLAGLLRDSGAIVPRLISMKQLLPGADVSALAAARPELLLQELEQLRGEVASLRQLLGEGTHVDRAVEAHPRLLDAELVGEVLEELRRLMPQRSPADVLLADPSWLSRVERGTRRLGDHPDM